jgi:hypothetical protein
MGTAKLSKLGSVLGTPMAIFRQGEIDIDKTHEDLCTINYFQGKTVDSCGTRGQYGPDTFVPIL